MSEAKCENCGAPAPYTGEFCEGNESGGRVPVCWACAMNLHVSAVRPITHKPPTELAKGGADAFAVYRTSIGQFVLNRVEEVTNGIGGVIGYKLNLNAEETEKLMRLIEGGGELAKGGRVVMLEVWWRSMPDWAKRAYHNDPTFSRVLIECSAHNMSCEDAQWRLIAALYEQRDQWRDTAIYLKQYEPIVTTPPIPNE